ncbi:hypothetical protein H0X06_00685 [Candidatus Dependentiae bacterium]|nr:hypothetical protein [Candidatus Dependentiae bacterium]
MTKLTLFSLIMTLVITPHLVQSVVVEGSKWKLDDKEVVLFFDAHNLSAFREREEEEVDDFIQVLKRYSYSACILEKYFDTQTKPLHILLEQCPESNGHETILASLIKKLAQEESLAYIVVENIEQRAASGAMDDVIGDYGKIGKASFNYRPSATHTFYHQSVTLYDVLDEYERIMSHLNNAYVLSSDKVKAIHEDKMEIIEYIYNGMLQEISTHAVPLHENFITVLDRFSSQGIPPYFEKLGKIIHQLFSCIIDLYALHRVLSISSESKVVLVAGADHSLYVQSRIMGTLDAESEYGYGDFSPGVKTTSSLKREDFYSLLM